MPNAMLAATPPLRTSRSSARNDNETLSSCSTTRESRNLPLKVMRWSVAMDPVTAICTRETYLLSVGSAVAAGGPAVDSLPMTNTGAGTGTQTAAGALEEVDFSDL